MSIKSIVILLVVLLAAGVWAWQRHGPELLRQVSSGPAAAKATKCLQGDRVLYTDGPCPAGSRAAAVEGGAVTVVPGQKAALPSLPAASVPNVRQVLAPDAGPNLREQRMEQVIGK